MIVEVPLTVAETSACENSLAMVTLMHDKLRRARVPVRLSTRRDRRHQVDKTVLVVDNGNLIWRVQGALVMFFWIP